jgi:hypothetical protein
MYIFGKIFCKLRKTIQESQVLRRYPVLRIIELVLTFTVGGKNGRGQKMGKTITSRVS